MCLVVIKGTPIREAEEDIICYKQIDITETGYYSMVQRFQYFLGLLYSEHLEKDNKRTISEYSYADLIASDLFISQLASITSFDFRHSFYDWEDIEPYCDFYLKGFHSYKRNDRNRQRKPNVECIIPKGSKYVEDSSGLICSSQIILNKLID